MSQAVVAGFVSEISTHSDLSMCTEPRRSTSLSAGPLGLRASGEVIVDDADGLEIAVDDRRSDEREATSFQVFADAVGQVGTGREVCC